MYNTTEPDTDRFPNGFGVFDKLFIYTGRINTSAGGFPNISHTVLGQVGCVSGILILLRWKALPLIFLTGQIASKMDQTL